MNSEFSSYIDDKAISDLQALGGARFVVQMIDIFLVYAPKVIAEARSGLARGNLEPVIRMGHSLRSSGRNLGAIRMVELAECIEAAGRAGQLPLLPPLLDQIEQAFLLVKGGFEAIRARMEP
jgi:HPt (histidine-containing phosphotransfer) domain-containing protein